jgi:hypothetical protein
MKKGQGAIERFSERPQKGRFLEGLMWDYERDQPLNLASVDAMSRMARFILLMRSS